MIASRNIRLYKYLGIILVILSCFVMLQEFVKREVIINPINKESQVTTTGYYIPNNIISHFNIVPEDYLVKITNGEIHGIQKEYAIYIRKSYKAVIGIDGKIYYCAVLSNVSIIRIIFAILFCIIGFLFIIFYYILYSKENTK